MMKKVLIFVAGMALGAYVMENYLYRRVSKVILEDNFAKSGKRATESQPQDDETETKD